MGIKSFLRSFRSAWRGVCLAAKGRNFAIELFAAAWAFLLVWTGNGGAAKYIAVAAASALVLGMEALNTALEKLCDRVSAKREDPIRDIKDIGAGAVLISAAASLVIAAFTFIDRGFWDAVVANVTSGGMGWAAVVLVILPIAALLLIFPSKKGERPDVQYYATIEGKDKKDGDDRDN